MDKIACLLKFLNATHDEVAEEARRLLSLPDAALLTDDPAHPTVQDALHLWRVRLRIGASRGHDLPGARALLETLSQIVPLHQKLDQYAFNAGDHGGSLFFHHDDGRFLGYVLGTRSLASVAERKPAAAA